MKLVQILNMKTIRKFRHDLNASDLSVGNIVPMGNSLGFYRIVKATDNQYEVKEVSNPYALLYYVSLMKLKYSLKRFFHRVSIQEE
jgi:S-ribosylhomocysteine lyase LuxS involved in autoinducer biosynthesis